MTPTLTAPSLSNPSLSGTGTVGRPISSRHLPIAAPGETGILYGVGTGPGDPELLTVKAVRAITASPVVAWFCKKGKPGNAYATAADHITGDHQTLPMVYPVTNERPHGEQEYVDAIETFFDQCAADIEAHLQAGRSVTVLNEGDAFFYGSFMHVYLRLKDRFRTSIVPGVTSVTAASSLLSRPLTMRDDILSIIPGTLPAEHLTRAVEQADALAIMKVGKNLPKIVDVLRKLGRLDRAWYVERASMETETAMPLADAPVDRAPYFSMVLIHGRGDRR
ncbi:precorrin-2 C(20)-methyltransferase [Fodinicurvata sp. EGI_FJ10296]|uniref:precorrin-2 C(20)-methyltransferase n=1 Tax=Fodinicurvata sp. EGI_FJ10296 TaxID=3231908 RepID=UPI00345393A0